MLQEYFAVNITESGNIESLPLLLSNYTPDLDRLPLFLMRLGPQVRKARFTMVGCTLTHNAAPLGRLD